MGRLRGLRAPLLAAATSLALVGVTVAIASRRDSPKPVTHKVLATSVDCSAGPVVVTKNITLGNDPTCGANNGFQIAKSGVTVNLNGHSVTGQAGTFGVYSSGFSNVTVENGTLLGFSTAVEVDGGSRNRILRIHAGCPGCPANIAITMASSRSLVQGNTIYLNARGISVTGSDDVIDGNTIRQSSQNGIVVSGNRARVTRNKVLSSASDGIYVATNGANMLSGNTTSGNGTSGTFDGINALADRRASFSGNVANYNTKYGIEAYAGAADAGRNSAHGNAQLAQCLNIVCA